MPDPHDVEGSLRSLATDLEARSRPTTPAAAMARRAPVRRPRPRPGRVRAGVLAAVLVAAAAVGAGLIRSDGGRGGDRVETDQSPSSTPAPTGELPPPVTGTIPSPTIQLPQVPFADLPAAGFADVTSEGVVLFALDGTELGTGSGWPEGVPARGSDLLVRDDRGITTVEVARPDPAQAPEGCDAAAGAGGTRLALCDGGQEIVRIDPSGARATVAEAPEGYSWSRALPSPDGRWMLTEAADDCNSAMAALGPTDGSGDRTTLVGDAMAEGHAVGWLPDGRAVSQLVGGGCDQADIPSRLIVTDPGGDDAELPIEPRGLLHMWTRVDGGPNDNDRTFQRAIREAGLERCCDAALNGADVFSGVVWEGVRVSVVGGDQLLLAETDRPGYHTTTVAGVEISVADDAGGTGAYFSCGGTVWHIGGEPLDVTDEALVVDVAEALIPHLYCTVDPLPSG